MILKEPKSWTLSIYKPWSFKWPLGLLWFNRKVRVLLIIFKDLTHSQFPKAAFTLHCPQGFNRSVPRLGKQGNFRHRRSRVYLAAGTNHQSPMVEEQVFLVGVEWCQRCWRPTGAIRGEGADGATVSSGGQQQKETFPHQHLCQLINRSGGGQMPILCRNQNKLVVPGKYETTRTKRGESCQAF